MDPIQLAFLLIIIGAFFQGTFGIFIKNTAPLKWENFWVIFAAISYFFGPLLFALFQINNLSSIVSSLPIDTAFLPMLFGMIWGIGAITFGICVVRIGISLTYTIILGLVTVLGAILPIFINKITLSGEAIAYLSSGLLIIIGGVLLSGYAGVLKDKLLNPKIKPPLGGILLAFVSGIFSSLLNIGFVLGKDISLYASEKGIPDTNASALVWLVVLFGGFITNFGYATYLLVKNKTVTLYKKLNLKTFLPILVSGVFWFGSFALFGIGSTKMGSLGPSVGWAMLISLSIVVSNIWGIKFGEWKGVKKALNIQLSSLGLIILGVILVAFSALK